MAFGTLPFWLVAVARASINAHDQKPEAKKLHHLTIQVVADSNYLQSNDKKSNPDPTQSRSRFTPGSFNEEKTEQLLKITTNILSFHDMYHLAIVSRLAFDFTDRRTP
ncbi:Hypothetical predicted protein, partial [Olea europaea subsp. europaea]